MAEIPKRRRRFYARQSHYYSDVGSVLTPEPIESYSETLDLQIVLSSITITADIAESWSVTDLVLMEIEGTDPDYIELSFGMGTVLSREFWITSDYVNDFER